MDPHENNFLFDEKTEKAHVIDFGSSQDTQYFHQLRDFYQFLILPEARPKINSGTSLILLYRIKDHIFG